MYKFGLLVTFTFFALQESLAELPADSNKEANNMISDPFFHKNLIECRIYCQEQDSKRNAQQTCKVFPEKKLVLTDCEVTCLKLSQEEISKASTCPCVSGKCVGDIKPPQNAAVRYIPEIFIVMFVMYTIKYII